jgi:hypothetical protein
MPSKSEKEQRKQLLNNLREKATQEFEQSLPMSRASFTKLFDYLDKELASQACDYTPKLTQAFLDSLGVVNTAVIFKLLAKKGGYCDCEILANVEEKFE